MTTYTPAVLVTGADSRGNLFAFWKTCNDTWIDGYNECEADIDFIRRHVYPQVQAVYFADYVMTGAEWVEAGCPLWLTTVQIAMLRGDHPADTAQEIERGMDAEMSIEDYRAMRQAETAEVVQQMKAGTFKLRPYSSFSRTPATPLSADEANFYGMDE